MKPSEKIKERWEENLKRYQQFDPDTKHLASILNVVLEDVAKMLDQMQQALIEERDHRMEADRIIRSSIGI